MTLPRESVSERERARQRIRPILRPNFKQERVTHGRHCPCSACCAQDWSEPQLAPCGMHGTGCPPVYDPMTESDSAPMVCDRCYRPWTGTHPGTYHDELRQQDHKGPEDVERANCCGDSVRNLARWDLKAALKEALLRRGVIIG